METKVFAWILFSVYVLIISYLGYRGYRRTRGLSSFAVGDRKIGPVIIGMSLAAQLTSVATFVINPGLIYEYGLAGLLGLGVAAALGLAFGLIVFSKGFRRVGMRVDALTLPQWFAKRYESRGMGIAFGFLSLLLVSYVVLIVVAMAYVMSNMLGVSIDAALLIIIGFVFSYVLFGGVNAHAYTNAVQAVVMLIVAIALIASGLHHFAGEKGVLAALGAQDANLALAVNPKSLYFRDVFEIFICNFVVGVALVVQPHILTKALYLRSDKELNRYLATAVGVGVIFAAVMVTGIYARLALGGGVKMDLVVPTYVKTVFSGEMGVLIGMGLLCAGFSTLEGILIALTAIVSSDLYLGLAGRGERRTRSALKVGRMVLVGLGVVAFFLARYQVANPTGGSVAIFAQYGVYGLFSCSFAPLIFGLFTSWSNARWALASVAAALLTYVGLQAGKLIPWYNNPGVLAFFSIGSGCLVMSTGFLLERLRGARSGEGRPDKTDGESTLPCVMGALPGGAVKRGRN